MELKSQKKYMHSWWTKSKKIETSISSLKIIECMDDKVIGAANVSIGGVDQLQGEKE